MPSLAVVAVVLVVVSLKWILMNANPVVMSVIPFSRVAKKQLSEKLKNECQQQFHLETARNMTYKFFITIFKSKFG